jgi:outer membrane biosynthesis protein TonB
MKSVYFIILLTLAFSIKLKRKDYLVNNDDIKNKFLTIMGDMSSALENTIKLMKDNAEKLGVEFSEEKSEENAEEVDEKKQQQKEQKKQAQQQKKQVQQQKKQTQQQNKQTQQQKKEQKEEKPEQEEKVGQQELVAEDNESLEDYELNNGGVDDSEVDAFQMVDDNEGIAQEPDIEF